MIYSQENEGHGQAGVKRELEHDRVNAESKKVLRSSPFYIVGLGEKANNFAFSPIRTRVRNFRCRLGEKRILAALQDLLRQIRPAGEYVHKVYCLCTEKEIGGARSRSNCYVLHNNVLIKSPCSILLD